MEVLIFGANGQDGHYLSRLCQRRGWDVAAVSRSNAPILGDVADGPFVTGLIRTRRPALIFHLAARSTTRHDAAAENHATIGTGTLNILEAVHQHSPDSRVFLAGSALQFINRGQPISEDDPWAAASPYAAARNYSNFLARYYRQLGVKVFFGYLFHHESPLRKPGHVSKTIADAARRAAAGETFQLELGDLSVEKEWTFAGDMVEAMLTLTQQDAVFEANLGSGIACSIADFAAACFATVNCDWRNYITQKQDFTAEYPRLVANPARIHSLGWRPRTTFQELARLMVLQQNDVNPAILSPPAPATI
jgi:GDPmannose 4,6-dehydratase